MTHEKYRPFLIFKNYDYNDDDLESPGIGFFNGQISKNKSIDEFRKNKNIRKRMKELLDKQKKL